MAPRLFATLGFQPPDGRWMRINRCQPQGDQKRHGTAKRLVAAPDLGCGSSRLLRRNGVGESQAALESNFGVGRLDKLSSLSLALATVVLFAVIGRAPRFAPSEDGGNLPLGRSRLVDLRY